MVVDNREWTTPLLKTYVDEVVTGIRREVDVASTEREKSAQVISAAKDKAAEALAVGLTERIESGDNNLRQHVEGQVETLKQMIEAQDKAVNKAEAAMTIRLEGMNEFRAQLADQNARGLSRELFEAYKEEANKKIDRAIDKGTYSAFVLEVQGWRRDVDAALTTAKARNAAYAGAITFVVIIVNFGIYLATHVGVK